MEQNWREVKLATEVTKSQENVGKWNCKSALTKDNTFTTNDEWQPSQRLNLNRVVKVKKDLGKIYVKRETPIQSQQLWTLQEISHLPETGTSQGGEVTLVLNDQCSTVRTNILYQSTKANLELGSKVREDLGKTPKECS